MSRSKNNTRVSESKELLHRALSSLNGLREQADLDLKHAREVAETQVPVDRAAALVFFAARRCRWLSDAWLRRMPWGPADDNETYMRRMQGQWQEFAEWWIEEAWLSLATTLKEHATTLDVSITDLADLEPPGHIDSAARERTIAVRDAFFAILNSPRDLALRQRIAAEFGSTLERDACSVPVYASFFEDLSQAITLALRGGSRPVEEKEASVPVDRDRAENATEPGSSPVTACPNAQRALGSLLIGWAAIMEGAQMKGRGRNAQRAMKRLNATSGGPIRWIGNRPHVHQRPLGDWLADIEGRSAAHEAARSSRHQAAAELAERDGARQADLGYHEKRRLNAKGSM